ncbi:NAD(P)H-dependent oxidoreductase [Phenylobacterium sp. 20VBR1]|uniref:NAD(P)H-dependent oxidoreductase n=1 Tax=Phenylobacterium glaciei TaxID=2803784 RepID=A0A941D2W0_9CAUL|nr:NAD(P)H-dependent oxidoreductase [Phenylobacterium glaciei]MBR7620572.1 NAD(P)H-dependent oxidoreductase [Phenylobacterium glaciei]
MKHAVIIAHPNPRSLTCSAGATYAEAVRALGHQAIVRDLYQLGFDPCLKAAEIPGAPGYAVGDDAQEERRLLADADVFAFIYPLWFNAPPAMLKGYVERVFSMGFGYGPVARGTEPLLEGRKLITFSFSGAPESWVRDSGALPALMTLFDLHLSAVTGLNVLDHKHTGGIVPGITEEAVAEVLAAVSTAVRETFNSDRASAG